MEIVQGWLPFVRCCVNNTATWIAVTVWPKTYQALLKNDWEQAAKEFNMYWDPVKNLKASLNGG
jgi:hypothetical protein